MKNRQDDQALDRVVEQIRSRRLPDAEIEAISDRVWAKLAQADPHASEGVDEARPIRSCDDYRALIPGLLGGDLSKSRCLLLESHTRECLPCRKALQAARHGESAIDSPATAPARQRPFLRRAMAAVLVAGVGLLTYWSIHLRPIAGEGAVVAASGGAIYRLGVDESTELAVGAPIEYGERIRTGTGRSALLELRDGSILEVRERSWLSLSADRRGATVDLERGSVIVQAAPQRDGHLYVATGDCLVSVTGTIFSVNHGTKGSRVSVIEGEVVVDAGGYETVLHPGQQTATHASLARIPVVQDISWSRDVDRYIEVMREVVDLKRALAEEVPRPDLRYRSRLIDLVPAETALYVSLPNLAETIAEADRILRERIAESRLLEEWFESREDLRRFAPAFDQMTDQLAEFGSYLGEEVLVTASLDAAHDDLGSPLVLAELRDAAGLRRFIESTVAERGESLDDVVFLDDTAGSGTADAEVYVWLGEETLLASDRPATVRTALAALSTGSGEFPTTPFGRRLNDAYAEGAGVIIAADIERFADSKLAAETSERDAFERTGLASAQHFLLEQKWIDGRTQHRGVLGFDGPRRGMAAWLAPPAPMGSLDFVSPDAKFAAAMLLADPAVMLDDVLRLAASEGADPETTLSEMTAELGFDLRDDAARAFGGEMAMAVDGPLLPEPSWKLVLEVYDRRRAVWIFEQLAIYASSKLREEGGPGVEIVSEQVAGRTFWSISGRDSFHFTFEDSYLIAAPNRALLDRAIRYRQSGYTLASAPRFRSLMPTDGRDNFSALFYQDALGLLEPLAERIASRELTSEQRQALDELAEASGPTLGYAYGEPERIVFAASGTINLLDAGLPGLLGLGGSVDVDAFFRGIVTRDWAGAGSES